MTLIGQLSTALQQALSRIGAAAPPPSGAGRRGEAGTGAPPDLLPRWEIPKDPAFGDLTTPSSFRVAARRRGDSPQRVAEELSLAFLECCRPAGLEGWVERVEVNGGYVNVFLSHKALTQVLREALRQRSRYGRRTVRPARSIHIEFVSANPTGPLSVAHGRQAAVGDGLVRLLRSQGFRVRAEYYVNDEGRQIELLGRSLRARCAELLGQPEPFPEDGYHGQYLYEMAKACVARYGDRLLRMPEARSLPIFCRLGMDTLLKEIRRDLSRFALRFDRWSSQQRLRSSGRIDAALEELRARGFLYQAVSPLMRRLEQLLPSLGSAQRQGLAAELLDLPLAEVPQRLAREGLREARIQQELLGYLEALAPLMRRLEQLLPSLGSAQRQGLAAELLDLPLAEVPQRLAREGLREAGVQETLVASIASEEATWLASTAFGDDKDRVVRKRGGELTYLAPDIAYHQWKFQRGFDRLVNLWGPDHHGYIARLKAAVSALGLPAERLTVRIVQLVTLSRQGKPVPMSKRQGEFVTLREVLDEVGVDATRFFFLMRTMESHLDVDLELAKSRSQDNPVYYVQYAHARIWSILAKEDLPWQARRRPNLSLLDAEEERLLMRLLFQYPIVLQLCADALEPHGLTVYLRKLAETVHVFYTKHRVLSDDPGRSAARLALVRATRQVLANGLGILGISAPHRM